MRTLTAKQSKMFVQRSEYGQNLTTAEIHQILSKGFEFERKNCYQDSVLGAKVSPVVLATGRSNQKI